MYCEQRSQYIRPNSKKNCFCWNYSRKYGIHNFVFVCIKFNMSSESWMSSNTNHNLNREFHQSLKLQINDAKIYYLLSILGTKQILSNYYLRLKNKFSNFSCMFLNPSIFFNLNTNCSNLTNLLDMRNLQEQAEKAFCYQKLFWPFTVWINCSSDLNHFANSQPSASNFKSFSRSLEQFFSQ